MRHNMLLASSGYAANKYFEIDLNESLGGLYGPYESPTAIDSQSGVETSGTTGVWVRSLPATDGRHGVAWLRRTVFPTAEKPINVGDEFRITANITWNDNSGYPTSKSRMALAMFALNYTPSSESAQITSGSAMGGYDGAYETLGQTYGEISFDYTVVSGYDKGFHFYITHLIEPIVFSGGSSPAPTQAGTLIQSLDITRIS